MSTFHRLATAVAAAAVVLALPVSGPPPAVAERAAPTAATPQHVAQQVLTRHPAETVANLPLGPVGLRQTSTSERLAPGVRLTTVVRGHASARDSWVLRSLQGTRSAAEDLAARVRAEGQPATVERIDQRAPMTPSAAHSAGSLSVPVTTARRRLSGRRPSWPAPA